LSVAAHRPGGHTAPRAHAGRFTRHRAPDRGPIATRQADAHP